MKEKDGKERVKKRDREKDQVNDGKREEKK